LTRINAVLPLARQHARMDAKGRDPLDYSLLAARDPLAVLAAEQQRWSVHVQLIERVADGLPVNVDPADAADLLLLLQRELPRHRADEEDGLFPLLPPPAAAAGENLDAVLDALIAEHRKDEAAAAELIDELARMVGDRRPEQPDHLGLGLHHLACCLSRHAVWEDLTVMPAAARLLTPDDIGELGRILARHRGIRRLR
jgi:iron-sulfur cluster repair protein YtfE (RIC family)